MEFKARFFIILGMQTDSSKFSKLSNFSLDYIKTQATRLTTGIQNVICKEIEALKTKIRTASSVTDTIHNYLANRKRSLWLWVEDRSLLHSLGDIFRSNLRKTCSCNDIHSRYMEDSLSRSLRNTPNIQDSYKSPLQRPNGEIHRYYHVFQKGELARLIHHYAKDLRICQEWFEQGNWVVIAEKV